MNPMKLILLAGAGYLVYTAVIAPHAAAQAVAAGAAPPPPSTPTSPQNPAAQPAGPTTPATPSGSNNCSMTPAPSNDALMRAATNPAWIGPVGQYCLNAWQWNYYRQQYQIQVIGNPNPDPASTQASFDDITDPRLNITAADYHALLARKGLSGLRYAPCLPYGGWSTLVQ